MKEFSYLNCYTLGYIMTVSIAVAALVVVPGHANNNGDDDDDNI